MLKKKKRRSTEEKSFVGEGVSVSGRICGREDLVIEGSAKGSIDLRRSSLIVGVTGWVEADILAADVTVAGRLKGKLGAFGTVKIVNRAEFVGEIRCKRISIEDGAFIKASIEMEEECEETGPPRAVDS